VLAGVAGERARVELWREAEAAVATELEGAAIGDVRAARPGREGGAPAVGSALLRRREQAARAALELELEVVERDLRVVRERGRQCPLAGLLAVDP
jgi:hypothetical protein